MGSERYTLYPDLDNPGQYLPLALVVEAPDGSPLNNYDFAWTTTAGVPITNPNAQSIQATAGGYYKVRISPADNSLVGCVASVAIQKVEPLQKILYSKIKQHNFAPSDDGKLYSIPIEIPHAITFKSNTDSNAQLVGFPVRKKLILYKKDGIDYQEVMVIKPSLTYAQNNTTYNPATFSGRVEIWNKNETEFKGGWIYDNGNSIGRVIHANSTTGSDGDCVEYTVLPLNDEDNIFRVWLNNSILFGLRCTAVILNIGNGSSQTACQNQVNDFIKAVNGADYVHYEGGQVVVITRRVNCEDCVDNCIDLLPGDFGSSSWPFNNIPYTNPTNNPFDRGIIDGSGGNAVPNSGTSLTDFALQMSYNMSSLIDEEILDFIYDVSDQSCGSKSRMRMKLYVDIMEKFSKDLLKKYDLLYDGDDDGWDDALVSNSFSNIRNPDYTISTTTGMKSWEWRSTFYDIADNYTTIDLSGLTPQQKARFEEFFSNDFINYKEQVKNTFLALMPLIEDCPTACSNPPVMCTQSNASQLYNALVETGLADYDFISALQLYGNQAYLDEENLVLVWSKLSQNKTVTQENGTYKVTNGSTSITYKPNNGNNMGYIEIKNNEIKTSIYSNTPTFGVGFTHEFNNNKNTTQVVTALQRILRDPIGKIFFAQFMQANESIRLYGSKIGDETFLFNSNGIRQNDKLIFHITDLPWGYNPIDGSTSHELGLTQTYQKGKIGDKFEIHLDPNYNVNNGVTHYITIHNGMTNIEEIATVIIHEMFVHVQKDVNRLEQLKNLVVNSPEYQTLIKSLKSPVEDHCELAKGNVSSYKNLCLSLDNTYNTIQNSLFYLRDIDQHKTNDCK